MDDRFDRDGLKPVLWSKHSILLDLFLAILLSIFTIDYGCNASRRTLEWT